MKRPVLQDNEAAVPEQNLSTAILSPVETPRCYIESLEQADVGDLTEFINADGGAYAKYHQWPDRLYHVDKEYVADTLKPYQQQLEKENNMRMLYVYDKDDAGGKGKIIGEFQVNHDKKGNIRISPFMLPGARNGGLGFESFRAALQIISISCQANPMVFEVETHNVPIRAVMDRLGAKHIGSGPPLRKDPAEGTSSALERYVLEVGADNFRSR